MEGLLQDGIHRFHMTYNINHSLSIFDHMHNFIGFLIYFYKAVF